MDFNLIIAVLSLLISAVSELKNWTKDEKESRVDTIGLGLVRLISILDDIIATGNRIGVLTDTLASMTNRGESLPPQNKLEALDLINRQAKNIRSFAEACDAPLTSVYSSKKVTLANTIELLIPDKLVQAGGGKSAYLKAITWKLLQGEAELSQLSIAGRCTLLSLKKSTSVDDTPLGLIIRVPTKVTIRKRYDRGDKTWYDIVDEKIATYNLNSATDIRNLVEDSHKYFAEIKELREKLSELIKEKFPPNISLAKQPTANP